MLRLLIFVAIISSIFGANLKYQAIEDDYNIDVDSIIADKQKSKSLFNCVMDNGECSVDESIIRALIRGAFVLCDEVPPYVRKYVYHLLENDEDRFFEMAGRFDREDGIFRRLYCKRMGNSTLV